MTRGPLLAATAAALGVGAGWELLAVLDRAAAPALRRALAPLSRARVDGEAPSAAERRRLGALGACALLAAGWLVWGPAAGLVLAAGGPLAARAALTARRRRWRADLADAAPTVARAISDALAGGHSIRGALLQAAGPGAPAGAAGVELRAAARALDLGEETPLVLERLRRRAATPAYGTLVAAILLQRDAGGDLSLLLRSLATSLEDAVRVERDARAATAQARFTGMLVGVLPTGAAAIAELAQPGFMASLVSFPPSAALLLVAVTLQLAGLAAVRCLGRLRT